MKLIKDLKKLHQRALAEPDNIEAGKDVEISRYLYAETVVGIIKAPMERVCAIEETICEPQNIAS